MSAEQDAYAIAESWWREGLASKPDPAAFGLPADYAAPRDTAASGDDTPAGPADQALVSVLLQQMHQAVGTKPAHPKETR